MTIAEARVIVEKILRKLAEMKTDLAQKEKLEKTNGGK